MSPVLKFAIALAVILSNTDGIIAKRGTFTVDFGTRMFQKDGIPFQYVAGCFHYFRSTTDMWKGVMTKMKDGGLNVLQTYVEWSSHEPEPGVYNFEGNLDLVTFLKTAQEVGLYVVLRPGPYICAERDFGGLPYWLLREKPDMDLRTMDPVYINYVDKWFDVLLPMIAPLLYQNGGPIILVQVENEYGQFPKCDHQYMSHMRDLNRKYLGNDIILFRTDIPQKSIYECDKVDGVLVTADFGPGTDVAQAFKTIQEESPNQPLVVTEFYVGWMDHWGEAHAKNDMAAVKTTMESIFALNGSVCIYMYFGGTNFGFSNGANAPFSPQPTSYDYAAPISEAGDETDAYFQIRDIISEHFPLPPAPKPSPTPKTSTGPVELQMTTTLLNSVSMQSGVKEVYSDYPLSFEELSLAHGFVAYSTMVKFVPDDPSILEVPGLKDRGHVYVDGQFKGIISRHENIFSIPLIVKKFQTIMIIVENQGRINFGLEMSDPKGLVQNVTLSKQLLDQWAMIPIPLTNIQELHTYTNTKIRLNKNLSFQPAFYTGKFVLPKDAKLGASTFLNPTGWYRGVAFLNGFNLGRYWPVVGPQVTLFVPASVLEPYPRQNVITLLELEKAPCAASNGTACTVTFVDAPILDGPTPTFAEKTLGRGSQWRFKFRG